MRVFFSVGEPSGDLHGANLVKKLSDAGAECIGFGGPKMKEAGCEIVEDLTKYAVMLWNAFLYVPKIFSLYRQTSKMLAEGNFDAMVLIDYPGFNWWMARCAKKHNIPVFYYGLPQVWAWNPSRVKKLKRLVDYPISKLPFEEKWYAEHGVDAHYVGHPYFDELSQRKLDQQFLKNYHDPKRPLLTLLPGSRNQEVKANLESLVKSALEVQKKYPESSIAVACFSHRHAEYVRQWVADYGLKIDVFVNRTAELIEMATVCLACSGSVSLELMYHAKPSVIVYRIGHLTNWIKNRLVQCKFITLVNLFSVDSIEKDDSFDYDPSDVKNLQVPFPEFLSVEDRSKEVAEHVLSWLNDPEIYRKKVEQLEDLRDRFATTGATEKAGQYILKRLAAAAISSPDINDSHQEPGLNSSDPFAAISIPEGIDPQVLMRIRNSVQQSPLPSSFFNTHGGNVASTDKVRQEREERVLVRQTDFTSNPYSHTEHTHDSLSPEVEANQRQAERDVSKTQRASSVPPFGRKAA